MTSLRTISSLTSRALTLLAAGVDAGSTIRHGGTVPPDHPARRPARRKRKPTG